MTRDWAPPKAEEKADAEVELSPVTDFFIGACFLAVTVTLCLLVLRWAGVL